MNDFYVYMYIRSKDSVTAKAGTPYYIGKGRKKRRFEKHTVSLPSIDNNVILFDNLLEMGAFILERNLIRWYGRKDLGTGILHNRTDGGDGGAGRRDSADTIKRRSLSNTGKKRSKQTCENISNALKLQERSGPNNPFYNERHTAETLEKMSAAKKGKTYEEIFGVEKAAEMRLRRSQEGMGKKKGKQTRIKCDHCGVEGGISIMKRWHGSNCKKIIRPPLQVVK